MIGLLNNGSPQTHSLFMTPNTLVGLLPRDLLPPPRLRKKPGGIDSKFNVDYELFMPQAEKLVSGGQNRDFRHFSSFFK